MVKEKLKTLTEQFLIKYPETRNSDTLLILTYLWKKGILNQNIQDFEKLKEISDKLPAIMGLGRHRANFQNKLKKYEADALTQEIREEEEQDWRETFKR